MVTSPSRVAAHGAHLAQVHYGRGVSLFFRGTRGQIESLLPLVGMRVVLDDGVAIAGSADTSTARAAFAAPVLVDLNAVASNVVRRSSISSEDAPPPEANRSLRSVEQVTALFAYGQ